MNKRLIFIVEGETEKEFVENLLVPQFNSEFGINPSIASFCMQSTTLKQFLIFFSIIPFRILLSKNILRMRTFRRKCNQKWACGCRNINYR